VSRLGGGATGDPERLKRRYDRRGAREIARAGATEPVRDRKGSHTPVEMQSAATGPYMFATIDLDPDAAAAALDDLANDLRLEPGSLGSRAELSPQALAAAEETIQHWAVTQGVPAVCVPERPSPQELTVQRALLFLSDLAAVVRYIADNGRPQSSMSQVVARLRARNDEALGEIVELDFALTELYESVTVVAGAAEALHATLAKMGRNGTAPENLAQLQRDAGLIHSMLEQIVEAHGQINTGVKAWVALPESTPARS
jgi:hypothetical protein